MNRRVFGLETEYGITCAPPAGVAHSLDAEGAARALFAPLIARGRSSNNFLPNGGRLYLDVGAHPEYATAECDTLPDLLAQDRAGDEILADLAGQAQESLDPQVGQLHLFRNNFDSQGNSYGCHENYLLRRRRDFQDMAEALLTFFVTRQLYCGAGHLLQEGDTWSYHLSGRAHQVWDKVSAATTRSRPIINTRDEPHADAELYRRLHVIVGDSNMAETATALKIFTTTVILNALENGVRFADLALAQPLAAIREISAARGANVTVELADGRLWTPAELQSEFLSRAGKYWEGGSGLENYLWSLWQRALLAAKEENYDEVATEIEWVAKERLLERYRARFSLPGSDIRLARLLLAYHDITAAGLRPALESTQILHRLTKREEVQRARNIAPETTRAALRGRVIDTAWRQRRDLAVDWVNIRFADGVHGSIALKDPFAVADERVEQIIAAMECHHDPTPV